MKDNTWIRIHAAAMLLAMAALWWAGMWTPILIASTLTFGWLILSHAPALRKLRPFGGYANLVTLARWLLLLYAGYSYDQWSPYIVFAFFLMVIVLDGIDGYLARRYDQSTQVGGLLDVETDALMCVVMAGIHYREGVTGGWILAIAGLRYGYIWVLYLLGWENNSGRKNPFARLFGVLYISSLMSPFIFPDWLAVPLLILGSLLVTFSFGYSLWGKRYA